MFPWDIFTGNFISNMYFQGNLGAPYFIENLCKKKKLLVEIRAIKYGSPRFRWK
jgi:hypothetical protein